MINFPHHDVSIVVAGREIEEWESYEIEVSMLEAVDHFAVRMPFRRDVWDICQKDLPVQVLIDNTPIVTGRILGRDIPEDSDTIEIVGVDNCGRLVKESAPGISYKGLGIKELVQKLADPWFDFVTLSNARNRDVIRGNGKKARGRRKRRRGSVVKHGPVNQSRSDESALKLNSEVGTQIQPGMMRWQVIETLCKEAGYLCWSSCDGRELIVGEPDYDQEIQFRFFMPARDSRRRDESTLIGLGVHESIADRYSRIIVVGSGQGTDSSYGASVASRYGESRDNPDTVDGEGRDFDAPKRLLLQLDVKSSAQAEELADREMDRRDSLGNTWTARAPGHGQVIAGIYTTLFAPDTLAELEDERTGFKGTVLITGCTYKSSRKDGEETILHLVPAGARLVS